MKLRIIIYILMILSVLVACNKADNSEFTDSPIVESYLTPGNYPRVRISRQIPFSSNVKYSSDDVNALSINILHNNISSSLTPVGGGQYVDSSLKVAEGDRYDLSFTYNSKSVRAYTIVPSKPAHFAESVTAIAIQKMDSTSGFPSFGSMPDPISLTWDNTDGSYYIVVIENLETKLVPVRDFGSDTIPGIRFRQPPTTASGLEIRAMEFQYFGKHRLILFHVLPDYASLYSASETSSQNLTNPSTSIMNGYGIFTGLNSDTLYLNVNQQQ
jgi:hypothetical protein